MEEDELIEETPSDFVKDKSVGSIYDRIREVGGMFNCGDDSLGAAFLEARPRRRIELINRISELLDLMKDYMDSELAELNELHSKIK
jgi:hypothetical protein